MYNLDLLSPDSVWVGQKTTRLLKVTARTCMYWYIPVCTNWEFLYWPVPSCTGTYWYVPVRTILPNPVQGYRIPDVQALQAPAAGIPYLQKIAKKIEAAASAAPRQLLRPARAGAQRRRSKVPSTAVHSYIWILASSDIGVLPDITDPDIGDLRISQHPYSDIGVTDIGELRYHSITTPISEYQCSDIDSDIRGAVITEV